MLLTWDLRTRNKIARNEITYLLVDGNIDLKSIEVEIIARTSGFRCLLLKVYEDQNKGTYEQIH